MEQNQILESEGEHIRQLLGEFEELRWESRDVISEGTEQYPYFNPIDYWGPEGSYATEQFSKPSPSYKPPDQKEKKE